MKAQTALALYKFADAAVFVHHLQLEWLTENGNDKKANLRHRSEALSNLKMAKQQLFDALEKEDLE